MLTDGIIIDKIKPDINEPPLNKTLVILNNTSSLIKLLYFFCNIHCRFCEILIYFPDQIFPFDISSF